MKNAGKTLLVCAAALAAVPLAHAAEGGINSGTTAWIMTATVLVLMMCLPGLAMFYGGVVREQNVLSVFTQMFVNAGVIGTLWVLCGYSLVTDGSGMQEGVTNWHSIIGGLNKALLLGVDLRANANGIPEGLLITFLMTFAMITPAIVTGGFAERMKFSAAILFMASWFVLCYAPMAHMVWGGPGALMHNWGALDFAGGTAVHINSGVAALVAAWVVGPRSGYPRHPMPPHNLVMTLVGAGLLWVGWFGFNVGSALAADASIGTVMLTTQLGACAGIVGWVGVEVWRRGHPSAFGAASGALAGLVGITPACAFVGPLGALVIGLLSGMCCYFAVTSLKQRFGYDDTLDVFGLHGIGGIVGAILTGVFAAPAMGGNVEGVDMFRQVWIQLASVLFTVAYSALVSWLLLKLIDRLLGLRIDAKDETEGLDLVEHNERAYSS